MNSDTKTDTAQNSQRELRLKRIKNSNKSKNQHLGSLGVITEWDTMPQNLHLGLPRISTGALEKTQ